MGLQQCSEIQSTYFPIEKYLFIVTYFEKISGEYGSVLDFHSILADSQRVRDFSTPYIEITVIHHYSYEDGPRWCWPSWREVG